MSIPNFDLGGVLPPFEGATPGSMASQSPFRASAIEMVERFGTTPHRVRLLRGLLNYREALSAIGIDSGFQWIDGSFVEDKESVSGQPPADIDIVTLFDRPASFNDPAAWRSFAEPYRFTIFNPRYCKDHFSCDAYPVDLGTSGQNIARQSAFWFSLFSHQRDTFRWKGIIQMDLVTAGGDNDASVELLRRGA